VVLVPSALGTLPVAAEALALASAHRHAATKTPTRGLPQSHRTARDIRKGRAGALVHSACAPDAVKTLSPREDRRAWGLCQNRRPERQERDLVHTPLPPHPPDIFPVRLQDSPDGWPALSALSL
jgi:hypothetical protein